MPKISIPDKDLERGKRFTKICEGGDFEKKTLGAIGKILGGYSASRVFDWKAGDSIPCRALTTMMTMGVDVFWLLTGQETPQGKVFPTVAEAKKSAPESSRAPACEHLERILATPPESCPNHGVCLTQARQLRLLVDIVSMICSSDAAKRSDMLEEIQQSVLRVAKRQRRAAQEQGPAGSLPKVSNA